MVICAELAVAGDARQRLAPILGVWGLSWQQGEDALLVMSELVSNAVEHAGNLLVLGVSFTGSAVLIEVSDGSLVEPQLQPLDTSTVRGRGLQFVDALARSWSWRADGDSKTVWAETAAVDQHERSTSDLLGDHGKLLTDTDQVEQAKQPRRAPRNPEVDGPQPSGVRGEKQRADSAGTEERGVRQRDLDSGGPRGWSQRLAEARVESRRRETVDIAMHADDHAPAWDVRDMAFEGSWFQAGVFFCSV
jgi:anti-sigma regulatory factor (Ser/Thr protein kinase)